MCLDSSFRPSEDGVILSWASRCPGSSFDWMQSKLHSASFRSFMAWCYGRHISKGIYYESDVYNLRKPSTLCTSLAMAIYFKVSFSSTFRSYLYVRPWLSTYARQRRWIFMVYGAVEATREDKRNWDVRQMSWKAKEMWPNSCAPARRPVNFPW